jgi:hypothetical protein
MGDEYAYGANIKIKCYREICRIVDALTFL